MSNEELFRASKLSVEMIEAAYRGTDYYLWVLILHFATHGLDTSIGWQDGHSYLRYFGGGESSYLGRLEKSSVTFVGNLLLLNPPDWEVLGDLAGRHLRLTNIYFGNNDYWRIISDKP